MPRYRLVLLLGLGCLGWMTGIVYLVMTDNIIPASILILGALPLIAKLGNRV